jgi:hypothetical protein
VVGAGRSPSRAVVTNPPVGHPEVIGYSPLSRPEYEKRVGDYDRALLELSAEQEKRLVLERKRQVDLELKAIDDRLGVA